MRLEAPLGPPWLRVRIKDHLLEKRKDELKKRRLYAGRARAMSNIVFLGARKLVQKKVATIALRGSSDDGRACVRTAWLETLYRGRA